MISVAAVIFLAYQVDMVQREYDILTYKEVRAVVHRIRKARRVYRRASFHCKGCRTDGSGHPRDFSTGYS